jgi:hypothetical protein
MDNSNVADDRWGVFARNWGDEGMCASEEHNLPLNDLKVLIPWLPGASAVSVLPDTQFYPFSNSDSNIALRGPQISVVQGQGVLLDFALPDSSRQMGVAGEVHLQWTTAAMRRGLPAGIVGRSSPGAVSGNETRSLVSGKVLRTDFHPGDEAEKPESRIAALLSQMPVSQVRALRAKMPIIPRTGLRLSKLAMPPVLTLASLPAPPRAARLVVPQAVPDERLAKRNELLRSALCQAYNDNVPGYPSACRSALTRPILRRRGNGP